MTAPTVASTPPPSGLAPVVDVRELTKVFGSGETEVHALRGIDLQIARGDYVAIMGKSGSGKSTLMNILGCLDISTSGSYRLDGIDVSDLGEDELSLVRNRKIGFVFQSFNLIARMTAQANVELPLAYRGVPLAERRARAREVLDLVGLTGRTDHEPAKLSGGQQQRVAIARALIGNPPLILADEPTGNLDSASTGDVLSMLDDVNRLGRTVVVITHEDDVAHRAQRVVRLVDGRIESDERNRA